MAHGDTVTVNVDEIRAETDKAFLVVFEDEEIWLPKSQIESPDDYEVGDAHTDMEIAEWLAIEKEMI